MIKLNLESEIELILDGDKNLQWHFEPPGYPILTSGLIF